MTDTATAPDLTLEIDGPIAWIVANNPERMNAYTARMWARIPEHVQAAEETPGVRVVILRGAGTRAFCAGADISEFESARTGAAAADYDRLNHEAFSALLSITKPVIAMIHGFCLGGGFGIAACADLRLADHKAQFSIPAAKLGLGYNPRWVPPLLALAPPAFLKEMLFTGRRFSAAEAERIGLVNTLVETDNLEIAVRTLANEIASNAPLTVRAAKLTIDELVRHPENPDHSGLDAAIEACFTSADYEEGRRAFLEKRKPVFTGR
ncbi:enoyl-CoA hydratase [Hyphomicrobium sp. LHD-15]|uniref:enoyl-CoA hydratase n=1 Tax=Hyphomicrobium sp. LHD-15 TaxID=3072142 RepID=UPI00280DBF01|nr:enoyl-CoA hydratase [Hyphomicrobium sp. LHD-15]MDQ8697231.1 enoyl-CoA hydratase [Hyphomicrobium sp. LHD-15]